MGHHIYFSMIKLRNNNIMYSCLAALCRNIYAYDILAVAYIAGAVLLASLHSLKIDFSLVLVFKYDIGFLKLVLTYIAIDGLLILYRSISRVRGRKCLTLLWRRMRGKYFNTTKLFHLFKVLLWLKLVLFVYCNIKQAIPFINPCLFDATLMRIDSALFLGHSPVALSVHWLGNPVISTMIDKLYVMWYLIKPFVLVYFAVLPVRLTHIHKRFFLAYFSMWILGGTLALLLPSLGPVYVKPDTFLAIIRPYAAKLQESLGIHYLAALKNPENYKLFLYEGIAAFPSLHVGIVAIFAFFLNDRSRLIGTLMFVYLAIIQIGSILLGWHYMVDGLFASGMAYLLYIYTKRMIPDGNLAAKSPITIVESP